METENVMSFTSHYQTIMHLRDHLSQRILGQKALIDRLLIALLCDGHLLVEGAPGLAKTKAIKELAACISGSFHRIQFTPDLLPGDLTGTDIYRPENGSFIFQHGPIFHNLLLADEINRAPAKVQSALLEAMAERQVTIGHRTYPLPKLFLVMATQNPIEQEGTYPLPEAQLDRFLIYVRVNYPAPETEHQILQLARKEAREAFHQHTPVEANHQRAAIIGEQVILKIREEILDVHLSPALQDYIVQLIIATRQPKNYNEKLSNWVRFGASPRATIALDRCARAHAWLCHRDFVAPEDIHAIAHDVLRHRIILTFSAEADGVTSDEFISHLLQCVSIP
jgi:MoxR-like ATPase